MVRTWTANLPPIHRPGIGYQYSVVASSSSVESDSPVASVHRWEPVTWRRLGLVGLAWAQHLVASVDRWIRSLKRSDLESEAESGGFGGGLNPWDLGLLLSFSDE